MIYALCFVTGLENISGDCHTFLGNEDSLLYKNILKLCIEDSIKMFEIRWKYTVNVKLKRELSCGSTENLMLLFYDSNFINSTLKMTRRQVA